MEAKTTIVGFLPDAMRPKKFVPVRLEEWMVEFLMDVLVEADDATHEQERALGTDDEGVAARNGLAYFRSRCKTTRRALMEAPTARRAAEDAALDGMLGSDRPTMDLD